jgi:hypothetical protein
MNCIQASDLDSKTGLAQSKLIGIGELVFERERCISFFDQFGK